MFSISAFRRMRMPLVAVLVAAVTSFGLTIPATATTAGATIDGEAPTTTVAADPYDVYRYFSVTPSGLVTFSSTPLRYGTTAWGLNHLIANGRGCAFVQNQIRDTLLYWTGYTRSGTSYTFRRVKSTPPYETWTVVVERGSGIKGIITAYNNLNLYC